MRAKEIRPISVNIELRALRAAFNTAIRWKLLAENPTKGCTPLPVAEVSPIFFTKESFQQLLDSITEAWLKEVIVFAAVTGLRRAEVLNLRWADVDLERQMVLVQSSPTFKTKQGKRRVLPLNEIAMYILRGRRGRTRSDYVFTFHGEKVREDHLTRRFKRAVRRARLATVGTEFIVCLEQGNRRTRSFVARGAPKNLLNSSGSVLGKEQVPALPVQGDAPGSELAFGAGTAYIHSSFSRRLAENAMEGAPGGLHASSPPDDRNPVKGTSMNYDVQVLKMGQCQVPGPEVYWMSHWDTWETLYFWMVVIRGGGKNVIINTGPPKDLTALNAVWKEAIDERSQMVRQEEERPDKALARIGLKPEDINYVLLTPLQAYATGNIPLFTRAQICLSKRGWIEDFHAPKYPIHIPRKLRIPDEVLQYLEIEAPGKLRLLADEEEVLPGIRAFWTGVHHRSSMAYVIDSAKGRVLASDSFFKYENVEKMIPLGIMESLEECMQAYERIVKEADILLPLYDPRVPGRLAGI